ncbi:MAG: hypothetical protein A2Z20_05345 [Bdellovibrionales bacterium RBG_16_40_8]|nr:MAG: hypothetical protein A2Z20_05345 [Bdellovibrionales bacterium RBG_16_40_8]
MSIDRELKRISLFIGENQSKAINDWGLNLSWLVRDLLDDFVKEKKIVLKVSVQKLEKIAFKKVEGGKKS